MMSLAASYNTMLCVLCCAVFSLINVRSTFYYQLLLNLIYCGANVKELGVSHKMLQALPVRCSTSAENKKNRTDFENCPCCVS